MGVEAPSIRTLDTDPVAAHCKVTLYDPLLLPWQKIRQSVLNIEQSCFPKNPETEEALRDLFLDPQSIVGIVTHSIFGLNRLAGFSIIDPARTEYALDDCEFSSRLEQASPDTGYVHCTEFLPFFQGRGLVAPLNTQVLSEAEKRYDFLERDALTDHDYAAKLLLAYKDKIETHHTHPSKYGEQEFMRLRLH